jgi:hypothetical protein
MDTEGLPKRFLVEFAEHIPPDQISGETSFLVFGGDVEELEGKTSFVVTVRRHRRLKPLKRGLKVREAHGILRWKELED